MSVRFAATFFVITVLAVATRTGPAVAHKPSDSYLTLTVRGAHIDGRWDVALRDLDAAIGLDSDDDGALTWGEVKARSAAIDAYALGRLSVAGDSVVCLIRAGEHKIDRHSDGAYVVLPLTATCPTPPRNLIVRYELLFDLDPQHRGLMQLNSAGGTLSTAFSPERKEWQADIGQLDLLETATTFLQEGVQHILSGFDHLLFLVALLLPAVGRQTPAGWRPVARPKEAFVEVVKVVSAFTLAHSLTLALATFGLVDVSPRIVEPLIAASIVFAAINNMVPLVGRGVWALAFLFGLVHGLGFANALKDLGLSPAELVVPLVCFNLGVEGGQLLVVALFLPFAYPMRRSWLYRRIAVGVGSLLVATTAALWFVERAFDLSLI